MQKQFYFLAPVEVVRVTTQNLEEVAEWCGGRVAQTESRRKPGQMDSYVWVPTPKGTSISWAFPGMFITKRLVVGAKDEPRITFAVFRKDYFEKNYFEDPIAAVDATWEKEAKKRERKAMKKLEEAQKKTDPEAEKFLAENPELAAQLKEKIKSVVVDVFNNTPAQAIEEQAAIEAMELPAEEPQQEPVEVSS